MGYKLLSGNEAIALGAYEAGVTLAAAYPGTPSTEILENLASYPGVYCEWSTNEKVALDVAIGAAYAGRRALASMKHVGLNVAADALFYASMTGTKAGLVIVNADDPNMYSSQNEQDNRQYARFARIPVLEPSDSEEARHLTRLAFELAERFDTPVMLRTVTRIAHSKSTVLVAEPQPEPLRPTQPAGIDHSPAKYVMVPGNARARHPIIEDRVRKLAAYAEDCPVNRAEMNDPEVGIITAGISYQYAREVFPNASVLKLGMVFPLPRDLIQGFARRVRKLAVIEELDPFIEEHVRLLGLEVIGKNYFPVVGELTPDIVREGSLAAGLLPLGSKQPPANETPAISLPGRPPVLCVGCGHRSVFYVLKKLKLDVHGDIGCYTLGVVPPLSSIHTTGCMGASIAVAHGALKAGAPTNTVAVIGDSTFFHTGIPALIDVVYNGGTSVTLILDNGTTAMTGHQEHPGTGKTLSGAVAPSVNIENLVRSLGVEDVLVLDAYDLAGLEKAIKHGLATDKPAVIIARHPCVLHTRQKAAPLTVDEVRCNLCGLCLNLGCQALIKGERSVTIDQSTCIGCEVCWETCARRAIRKPLESRP